MTTIRTIYFADPRFPATDQDMNAVRYPFQHPLRGPLLVDCVGPAPTQAEIDAVLAPVDQNDFSNLTKAFRAKCISDLAFRSGVLPGALTPAQIQAERTRIKNIADALS